MMENIETAPQLYQSKRKVIKNKRIVTGEENSNSFPLFTQISFPLRAKTLED